MRSVRVMASWSNTLPVVVEKFSVDGQYYSLAKSDCIPGQPLDPGSLVS